MNTPATAHAPASTFVPAVLDGSKWPALEPYYAQLIGRTLHDSASLERLLLALAREVGDLRLVGTDEISRRVDDGAIEGHNRIAARA